MASIKFQSLLALLAAALSLAAGGCGSSTGPTFKVTSVKGKVTQGMAPVADASVTLLLQGQSPEGYQGSGGKTDAQGNFEIMTGFQKGAPAGTYKVTVNRRVGPGGKPIDPTKGEMVNPNDIVESIPPPISDPAQTTKEVTVKDGTPVTDLNIEIIQAVAQPAVAQPTD